MYTVSHKISPTFMENLVDTKYHTRSCYEVELDGNGNVKCSKRSNYRPEKVNTSPFGLKSI